MGEAEERLVLDYLGQVADLAHGRLTPEARVAFLGRLRAGIEEQRAGRDGGRQHTLDVLDALGDPKRLVEAECLRLIDQEIRDGKPAEDGKSAADDEAVRSELGAASAVVPDWPEREQAGRNGEQGDAEPSRRRSRGRRGRRQVNAADLRRSTHIEREPPPWRRDDARPARRRRAAKNRDSARTPSSGTGWQSGAGRRVQPGGGLVAEGFNPVSGAEAMEILRTHRRESMALLLIGVGGLLFPYVFWPVGAFLVLGSAVWLGREKWIGLGAPVAITALAVISTGSSRANPRAGVDYYAYWSALLDVGPIAFRIAAVGGAAYLFFRLLRNA